MLLNASAFHPALTPLLTKTYSQRVTAIPNSALPLEFRQSIGTIWSEVTGSDQPAPPYYKVLADDGVFSRLLTPQVARNGQQVCIYWDDAKIDIAKGLKMPNDSTSLRASIEKYNLSGSGDDVCLKLLCIDDNDIVHTSYMQIRMANNDLEPNIDELSLWAERRWNLFVNAVAEPFSNLPTYSINDLVVGTYTIESIVSRQVTWGSNYLITILPVVDSEDERFREKFQCWSNTTANALFESGVEISPEKPATINVVGERYTKKGLRRALFVIQPYEPLSTEGAIDLSQII